MKRAAMTAFAAVPLLVLAQEPRFPLPPADWPRPVHDTPVLGFLLVDRLEYQASDGPDSRLWDIQGWIGGDYNKAWLKAEGHVQGGKTEQSTIDLLYARRVSPFWYLQAGARTDERPGPRRNGAVIGIQGIAPYWFDVESDACIRSNGLVEFRFESEVDFFLGQRLILQPRFETKIASRAEARGLGRGFRSVDVGLRLRYEIKREFAPYIGVEWTRQLGDTADFVRADGRSPRDTSIVAGVRIWY